MKFGPDTSNLSAATEQAAADIRTATDRVGDAADAAGVLMTVLSGAVVFALALAAAAYIRASRP
jgi:hypothetical protein